MSMWLDQKYIGLISLHLEKFKRKGSYLYNFRCPICGDSQTNKTKTRGYIFGKKGGMFFKCHNCHSSMSLGNFLQKIDYNVYKQYCMERYSTGETGKKAHKEHGFVFSQPKFGSSKPKELHENILIPIKNLEKDHEIIEYLVFRKIPSDRYNRLYYIDNVQKLKELASGYDDKISTNESRLVLPFYSKDKKLVGVSARGIRGEKFRYLTLRIVQDAPMIYGLETVDESKTIYVTEGPIDSLFLPNCVAVGNSNLKAAAEVLPKDKLVLLYDNEPRNAEIVKGMGAAIDEGFSLCIWPKTFVEKDINDMIVKGNHTIPEVIDTVQERTFTDARLLLEYNLWRV